RQGVHTARDAARTNCLADATMSQLDFQVGNERVSVAVRRLVAAGFTGRNVAEVEKHVAELQRQGVPPPPSIPAFYELDPRWVSNVPEFAVTTATASGEAEAVLIFAGDDLADALVTVGSDLTDREVERRSIRDAKQLPKPVGRQA